MSVYNDVLMVICESFGEVEEDIVTQIGRHLGKSSERKSGITKKDTLYHCEIHMGTVKELRTEDVTSTDIIAHNPEHSSISEGGGSISFSSKNKGRCYYHPPTGDLVCGIPGKEWEGRIAEKKKEEMLRESEYERFR